jgi:hypothetical protein
MTSFLDDQFCRCGENSAIQLDDHLSVVHFRCIILSFTLAQISIPIGQHPFISSEICIRQNLRTLNGQPSQLM